MAETGIRGVFIRIDDNGEMSHEVYGTLSQVERIAITKYFGSIEQSDIVGMQQTTLKSIKTLATAVANLVQEDDTEERKEECGKESSEEPSPS